MRLIRPIATKLETVRYRHSLVLLVIAGLILRLLFIFLPGYSYDINISRTWGHEVAKHGLVMAYTSLPEHIEQPNYPPLMMIIWGTMARLEILTSNSRVFLPPEVWIKIPSILADLVVCVVIYFILKLLTNKPTALLGSTLLMFNPAFFIDSSVWGQNDSICMAIFLIGLYSLMRSQFFISGVFISLSLLSKSQAIVFVPVGAFLFITLLLTKRTKLHDIANFGLGSLLCGLIVLFPFIASGKLTTISNVYIQSIGYYPRLSMNAFNFWWMIYGGQAINIVSTTTLFLSANYRMIGIFLFFIMLMGSILKTSRNSIRNIRSWDHQIYWRKIFYLFNTSFLLFFIFNTEMHERYLFPFIVLGVTSASYSKLHKFIYLFGSIIFILNISYALPLTAIDIQLFSYFPFFPIILSALLTANGVVYAFNDVD